jgi:hypothetical protein
MSTKYAFLLLWVGAGCVTAGERSSLPSGPDSSDHASDGGAATNKPLDAGTDSGTERDAATEPVPVIYAVSWTAVLIEFDPITNTLARGVRFTGVSSCTDAVTWNIAVDSKLNAVVTTVEGSHTLDLKTGLCKRFGASYNASALAFLALGAFSPSTETLVGYFSPTHTYRAFDATGTSTTTLASNPAFGDAAAFVATSDGRTFVADKGGELKQIDAVTGAVIKNYGSLNMGTVRGLASWGSRIYGFTYEGSVYSVEVDAAALSTPKLLVAQSLYQFAGAASAVPISP